MSAILNRIKEIRLKKGYSQEYMGQKLHMAQVSYGQIETGKRRLTVEVLIQIAAVFEIEPGELLVDEFLQNFEMSPLPLKDAEEEADVLRGRANDEIIRLKEENTLLRQQLLDKEKIIKLLEKNQ